MNALATINPAAVKHRGLITVSIMAAMIMQILDMTIANVALPHMQTSLGAAQDTITWVLTSYIVASAIATPITGWFADRIGRKQIFLICVAGFVGSSALCGTAFSLEEMVLFRIAQGARYGHARCVDLAATHCQEVGRSCLGFDPVDAGVGVLAERQEFQVCDRDAIARADGGNQCLVGDRWFLEHGTPMLVRYSRFGVACACT